MRGSYAIALLAVALSASAETASERVFARWLTAFNSRDPVRIRAFYAIATPAAEVESETLYAYEVALDTGGFDLIKTENASDSEITALVRERLSGQIGHLHHRYKGEQLTAFGYAYEYESAQPNPPHGRLTTSQIVANLDALMQRLSKAGVFSGVVLLAENDRPVFWKAFGQASKGYGIANRPDTRFNIGSVTKAMTAVAVAQLAEAGKLSFDDKVGKFLPDYANAVVRDNVTVHQLLTHTSGIVRVPRMSEPAMAIRPRLRTVRSWLPLFADKPPDFTPGSQWRYSNEGYLILGAIIEKASGEDYFDYIRKHIFEPAKMRSSGFFELDQDLPNIATGYTRIGARSVEDVEQRRNDRVLAFVKGMPFGGAFASADDLLRFKKALFANALLSKEMTARVTTGSVETGDSGRRYAYGFEDDTSSGTRIVHHSGAVPGNESRLEIYPERGYTVISLCNCDYQVVHRRLRDWITRK